MRLIRLNLLALSCALASLAQATSPAPYAGQQTREIKALSGDEQADLLAGKGMGLAKAAELNGYPGPAHVLELAGDLALSAEQRARTQAVWQAMDARARALGQQVVDAERELDALFASKQVTRERLGEQLDRIGCAAGAPARRAPRSAPGAGAHPHAGADDSVCRAARLHRRRRAWRRARWPRRRPQTLTPSVSRSLHCSPR